MQLARLSPTVDRFLAMRFVEPLLVSLAAFCGIYLLADVFDRFDDLVHYGGFNRIGLEYFLLKLPLIVSQLLPVASLAAVLLAFALLNRSGEVLAFQTLGISRLELALPVLVISVVVAAVNFTLNETVVPIATRQARYLYTVKLKKKHLKGVFANRDIWMRQRNGFLSVDNYDPARETLTGVTVFHLAPDFSLRDIHHAASARWDGRQWRLAGLEMLTMTPGGSVQAGVDDDFQLEAQPSDFGLLKQDPEEFSLGELNHYIRSLRRKGLNPGGYLVDRDLKYAMPIACIIMVALGAALSLDPLPRHLSLGRSFGLGIGIGFLYWLVLGFTSSFGRSGVMPAWLGAWLPNLIFASITLSIFLFGEEHNQAIKAASATPQR